MMSKTVIRIVGLLVMLALLAVIASSSVPLAIAEECPTAPVSVSAMTVLPEA